MSKLIGTEPWQVPTNGDLGQMAYMPFRPCSFRARSELSSTRPATFTGYSVDGSENKATFDRSYGAFNAESGIFTAPYTGVYLFTVKVTWTDDGDTRCLIKLYKNDNGYDEIIDQEPADYYMSHDVSYAGLHYAEVGDTFKLSDEVQPSSGSSSVIWTACYMQNG